MAENGRLSAKQHRAIRALLSTATIGDAAKRANVGERTIYRWLQDPAFKQRLTEAEADALGESVRRLVALQSKSLDALEEVLENPLERTTDRLRAAAIVLDTSIQLRALYSVEQRLLDLEARHNET